MACIAITERNAYPVVSTKLQQIAAQFVGNQTSLTMAPLGNGLINDTYLVESHSRSFILQCINRNVFPRPEQVMDNLCKLQEHIRQKKNSAVQLQIPDIIHTGQGATFYQDENHRVWRALEHIYPSENRNHIQHTDEAAQIGFALGHFHRLCADLAPEMLHDTLPGFHIAPGYFAQYQQLITQTVDVTLDNEYRHCRNFIESHQDEAYVLENAKNRGDLLERVIHGDPKLNNFLFEPNTNRIISLIDLDTVKPGLVHYDIGDCLRSCCHNKANNHFNLERATLILQNYLQEAGEFFTANDYDYLYPAIWLIPFELGLRFFSDYLAGNRYFKISEPRQNLKRAMAQFALCDSIAQQQTAIRQCIAELKDAKPACA